MTNTEWESFLNNAEVRNRKHHLPVSPDKYLFGKVLHDVLECLNMFLAAADLAEMLSNTPVEVKQWFYRWSPVIKILVSDLTTLWEYYELASPTTALNWQELIAVIGDKLQEVSNLEYDTQALGLSPEEKLMYAVKIASNNTARLNCIYHDILNKQYLKLWKTNYKEMCTFKIGQ
jgi:hypothetical protein